MSSPPSYQEAASYAIARGQLVNNIKEDVKDTKENVKNIKEDTNLLRTQVASLQGEVHLLRSDLRDIKALLEYNLRHTTHHSYLYKDTDEVKIYNAAQAAKQERKAREKADRDTRCATARAARILAREEAYAKRAAERELKELQKKMKKQQL